MKPSVQPKKEYPTVTVKQLEQIIKAMEQSVVNAGLRWPLDKRLR